MNPKLGDVSAPVSLHPKSLDIIALPSWHKPSPLFNPVQRTVPQKSEFLACKHGAIFRVLGN